MSKKNFIEACVAASSCTMDHSRNEVNLFCEIMEWSKEDVYFVGDDPHGIMSLGDYFFNMSDIHEVVANYEKHIERFGSNEELSNAIIRWYDWTTDWHNNHMPMEFVKVWHHNNLTGKDEKLLPEEDKTFLGWFGGVYKVCKIVEGAMHECDGFLYDKDSWSSMTLLADDVANELESYAYIRRPDYSHNINLHSWLMGACDLVKS